MNTDYDTPTPLRPGPDLRVVPLDTVWVHEDWDRSRFVALRDSIEEDGVLQNPVVVTSATPGVAGGRRFVHLDGANRIAALRSLGCAHVVIQVVDLRHAQEVRLSTWAHLTSVKPVDFLKHLKGLPEVDLQPLSQESFAAQHPAATAFIFFKRGAYQLSLRSPTVMSRIAVLRATISFYGRRIERCQMPLRPEPHVVAKRLATSAPDKLDHILITFVPLVVSDFLELASQGVQVPPGVSRFVLCRGRALGVNAPLSILRSDRCAADADNWLANVRNERPVAVPGPCRMREYLGWRDYDHDELLLLYRGKRCSTDATSNICEQHNLSAAS